MSFVMEEEGKPETRVEFDDEQVNSCRQILIDVATEHNGEKPTRRNPVFFKVAEAVKRLDEHGFQWGAELDDCCRRWGVVAMLRAATYPRQRRWPRFLPAYIEIF